MPDPGIAHLRRTKIVATLGPSSATSERIAEMILAGMDVARLNLSHGSWSEHYGYLEALRTALAGLVGGPATGAGLVSPSPGHAAGAGLVRRVGVLFDLRGPEIRLGTFAGGAVTLREGQFLTITTAKVTGTVERVGVEYGAFPELVGPGDLILLDDGNLALEVVRLDRPRPGEAAEVVCRIKTGGVLRDRKKINLPGRRLDVPYLSPKDLTDLENVVRAEADFVAASFTRRAEDVRLVREFLRKRGGQQMIVAKVESQEALENLDSIIEEADALMVARGDLGVEVPPEDVPILQKDIIARAVAAGKPVITATQMLESMVEHPRPTRAEASDVANAIFDGTDAVMLSAETATGSYPVEAVATMAGIARRTEEALGLSSRADHGCAGRGEGRPSAGRSGPGVRREARWTLPATDRLAESPPPLSGPTPVHGVTAAISLATVTVASRLRAGAIVATTTSGYTARMVARHRPATPIIAVTADDAVARQQTLTWGVYAVRVDDAHTIDEMLVRATLAARQSGLVEPGSIIVITAGAPSGVSGTTNLIKVHTLGRVLTRGRGLLPASAGGPVRVCRNLQEAASRVGLGDILVTTALDDKWLDVMRRAAAWITTSCENEPFVAAAALSLGRVAIVGAAEALTALGDGVIVTLDGARGLVYEGRAAVL
jgi:pyruvate kinase